MNINNATNTHYNKMVDNIKVRNKLRKNICYQDQNIWLLKCI